MATYFKYDEGGEGTGPSVAYGEGCKDTQHQHASAHRQPARHTGGHGKSNGRDITHSTKLRPDTFYIAILQRKHNGDVELYLEDLTTAEKDSSDPAVKEVLRQDIERVRELAAMGLLAQPEKP